MLYNIKTLSLHCVFHGIRFKVNEDWVSVIDTLLFFVYNRYKIKKGRCFETPPFLYWIFQSFIFNIFAP